MGRLFSLLISDSWELWLKVGWGPKSWKGLVADTASLGQVPNLLFSVWLLLNICRSHTKKSCQDQWYLYVQTSTGTDKHANHAKGKSSPGD